VGRASDWVIKMRSKPRGEGLQRKTRRHQRVRADAAAFPTDGLVVPVQSILACGRPIGKQATSPQQGI
jgi:hypothetical protein